MGSLDLQQTFDKVALHLLKQNAKSLLIDKHGHDWGCSYRGTEGRMCAIGCLIPDNMYHMSMEGENICSSEPHMRAFAESIGAIVSKESPTTLGRMLSALQAMHDKQPVVLWKLKLVSIAETFNLSAKVVADFLPVEPQ